ncbi:AraC family transcriptional regulator [Paenibacillus alginolyticus]|uniref:AraC family transcriptional regulator n=1 Tax=Paenibacillus alginolyticus TaxID=59839 RepID=A0ABT4GH82_9BACL|nr:helix-turn-helix domain-containing protein [Paenibacillus alginolyticus]MCY9667005.1 AraC family transcriptional regulator [Paenibacillus alginolyticus]MCY9695550.1 AraC family transcriptional regulator [Paenibacillus alginolyticus]MEC0142098.1 helix-turn-helix domain-containing protein [Paenibacillus alginolyticus]
MRSLSFLSKMTIFGFLLSTLPVIFIGAFAFVTSSSEIQKNVNEGKMQLITQINSNVEQKLTTVNHTLNQVINSTVLKKAMDMPLTVNDFMMYDDLRSEIRYMQSFDTKLEDVILINARENWMIKNSGLYRYDSYPYYDKLMTLMNTQENSVWTLNPSKWFFTEENARSVTCEFSISLVKKLPTTGLEKYGLALANIPACSLQDLIQSDTEHLDDILIMDEQNRILMHPDASLIGKSITEAGLTDLKQLEAPMGQFSANINEKSYSVSFLRSNLNNWTYLSLTSIDSLTKESSKIGTYTIYVCVLMLLLSMILAWLGSRKMYSPIQLLLNQIGGLVTVNQRRKANEFQMISEHVHTLFQSKSQLEREVHQHIGQVRTFFLIKAFQGHIKQSELLEKLAQFGYNKHIEEWKTMSVITMQIDSIDNTRYEKRDIELLLFAVHNILEELIPSQQRLVPIIIDQTVVTLIGSADNEEAVFRNTVYALTEQMQQHIYSFLNLHVSIGMSLPIHAFSQMAIAYREGLEALKHRIKLGEGIIIQYENINSGKHYLNLNYPKPLENELIDAIKLAEKDKSKELLKQLLQAVFAAPLTPQEYQIPLARLLNNLLMVMQESGIGLNQIHPNKGSLFEELLNLHMTAEIEDWFWTEVIHPLIRIYRDRQDAQYHNISEKIIDLVQHYYDTDLTLEECASRLHYNANYLSSIFRKETNCSFSDYLSTYRFNMAKKWLSETDMPIKDISSKLRYNNSQNFIRSFRKQEGLTPGQYRDKKKEG